MNAKGSAAKVLEPIARLWAARTVVRMLGIWAAFVVGHGHGGLLDAGVARTNVYRYSNEFRKFMGSEPEHFRFHPDDASLLIDYLKTHQDPTARRCFTPPATTRVDA